MRKHYPERVTSTRQPRESILSSVKKSVEESYQIIGIKYDTSHQEDSHGQNIGKPAIHTP